MTPRDFLPKSRVKLSNTSLQYETSFQSEDLEPPCRKNGTKVFHDKATNMERKHIYQKRKTVKDALKSITATFPPQAFLCTCSFALKRPMKSSSTLISQAGPGQAMKLGLPLHCPSLSSFLSGKFQEFLLHLFPASCDQSCSSTLITFVSGSSHFAPVFKFFSGNRTLK